MDIIYKDSYLPVDPDFNDILTEMIESGKAGKVHFFNAEEEVDDVEGTVMGIEKTKTGEYLAIDHRMIRLDKIITVFGRPGPSYEAYDAYANACLTCFDPATNKKGNF